MSQVFTKGPKMPNRVSKSVLAILLSMGMHAAQVAAADPPVIPVGADAYKMWVYNDAKRGSLNA